MIENEQKLMISAAASAPTEWRGEAGVVGPFESRTRAQTFASFRVDFSRLFVERTFAKGSAWYLELNDLFNLNSDE